MDKQDVVYLCSAIIFSLKILTPTTTWMNLEDFALRETNKS